MISGYLNLTIHSWFFPKLVWYLNKVEKKKSWSGLEIKFRLKTKTVEELGKNGL